jgi:hypothetical protein
VCVCVCVCVCMSVCVCVCVCVCGRVCKWMCFVVRLTATHSHPGLSLLSLLGLHLTRGGFRTVTRISPGSLVKGQGGGLARVIGVRGSSIVVQASMNQASYGLGVRVW